MVGLALSSWEIIIHLNLDDYCEYEGKVEAAVNWLKQSKGNLTQHRELAAMVEDIENRYEIMKNNHKIIMLNKKQKRKSRAPLSFIGSIQHALFGVMDEEHAQELANRIKNLKTNENYLLELLKNHSSVQDITSTVLRNQTVKMARNFNWVNNSMYQLQEELNNQLQWDLISNSVMSTSLAMQGFEMLQRHILDLIWNKKGSFMEQLLPLNSFEQQIRLITMNLNEELRLPDTDPLELARVARVTTATFNNLLLFKIKLPLIHKEMLNSFAVFAYPTYHDGYMVSINPSSAFILMNQEKTKFTLINENQLNYCQQIEKMMICPHSRPVFRTAERMNCEVNLLARSRKLLSTCSIDIRKPEPYWAQLYTPNSWIFSVNEITDVDVICQDEVEHVTLVNQGIIQVKPNCRAVTPETTLWAFEDIKTNVSFMMPLINITAQLPMIRHFKLRGKLETFELPNIPKPTTILGFPTELSWHELSLYGMTTTNSLIIIALVIIMLIVLKKVCFTTVPTMLPVGGVVFRN